MNLFASLMRMLFRPRTKERYRWTCVNGMWRWWSVEGLADYDDKPGTILEFMP